MCSGLQVIRNDAVHLLTEGVSKMVHLIVLLHGYPCLMGKCVPNGTRNFMGSESLTFDGAFVNIIIVVLLFAFIYSSLINNFS